ncbi:MAG: hypothetical protein ABIQ73_19520 [Acidimicrobiales bacterium]
MRYLRPALAVTILILAGCGTNAATDNSAAQPPAVASSTSGIADAPGPTIPSSGTGNDGRPDSPTTSGTATASIVPAVDVVDVSTGQSVALRASIATDKPTLIWMWAPH